MLHYHILYLALLASTLLTRFLRLFLFQPFPHGAVEGALWVSTIANSFSFYFY